MNPLRPQLLKDVVGQDDIKQRLRISIDAALSRGEALPHTLADGAPGLGKTTLACAIANELGVGIQIANGANLRSVKSLLPYIARVKERDVLFIDEIHRCGIITQEFLYPIMEDFKCCIGEESKMSMELPKFTLIGATTEGGMLAAPLYDRFLLKYYLELYSVENLSRLVAMTARKLSVDISAPGCRQIAQASRGTPRIANSRLMWVRDYATSEGLQSVSDSVVQAAFALEGVDANGMDRNDRVYLQALRRAGSAMGLKSLVAATNISQDTIENTIEPFLLRQGLIRKTPKGRVLCG